MKKKENKLKKILVVLFVMHSVAMYPMFDWFSSGKKSSTEVDKDSSSERESVDRSGSSGRPPGVDAGEQQGSSSSSSIDRSREDVQDKEGTEGSSRAGGVEFRDTSSIKKTLKLDTESKKSLKEFSEGQSADALRAFKNVFEDLQTTRTEKSFWRSSSKDTFMLDVLERVGESGKLTGQDMVDLRQSLESFTDVVEKLGNPDSEMSLENRQAMADKLQEVYGKDLGRAMRELTSNVVEAFSQLPLEGSGVDPREINELSKGLEKLQKASRDGKAFREATLGRTARDFSDMTERMKNNMKEKYDSWVKVLKRILIAVAAVAAVVVGIVFLHYILIAIKIMLIVGALGALGYGCYKAPWVCIACWEGVKSLAKTLGEMIK